MEAFAGEILKFRLSFDKAIRTLNLDISRSNLHQNTEQI
ncbi:hypothetical protein CAMRE0001_0418 [Campylobacter rectus RM3267]|uniref:Uncharacterized protein n=1 Tax=Campylobacter rectus RM3267 TaxID=553218 RepID=B9D2I5_CAMRE|nr:hypothetical protein CAMRE0001_0418 [Campylobacter rectus RM3267]